ncbi:MAG: type II toxin-antitoxin system prevent-host-death family antitoxin [Bifidobacteriaceae bacterium]|nr:type II toxin-antitoxin system prevent-host-death family antitoxin [Bifidobacteriaceae bacterium]
MWRPESSVRLAGVSHVPVGSVGIRALKQNASAVVAAVADGALTVTDRGRPVARIVPLSASPLAGLLDSGRARPPKRDIRDLPAPAPGGSVSGELAAMRDAERR